jgi:hypothetical protein
MLASGTRDTVSTALHLLHPLEGHVNYTVIYTVITVIVKLVTVTAHPWWQVEVLALCGMILETRSFFHL